MFDKIIKKSKCHCEIFSDQLEKNYKTKLECLRTVIDEKMENITIKINEMCVDGSYTEKTEFYNYLQGERGLCDWLLKYIIPRLLFDD